MTVERSKVGRKSASSEGRRFEDGRRGLLSIVREKNQQKERGGRKKRNNKRGSLSIKT